MARILVINGPNLDRLGSREPEIYGTATLADVEARLRAVAARRQGLELAFFQSNSEGALIDWLYAQAAASHGLVLNPGGLAHTSVVLRDAVSAAQLPAVEVHLTNIHARDSFRRRSLVAGACLACVCGMGVYGYEAALEALARHLHLPAPA